MIEFMSRFKNVLVGALLLILSAYYVNSSMCYHSHVISGNVVYHSHIHSTSHTTTSDDGGHSQEAMDLIATLSNFSIEQQAFNSHIEAPERTVESVALVRPTAQATFFLERCGGLRAPPIA